MLAIERREAILGILEAGGSAMVSDLSAQLGVTEETIRRDLAKLEDERKLRRVHGGAYLLKGSERSVPVQLRRRFFIEEKRRIAKRGLELIAERDSVMLDCSTTALVLAQEIREAKRAVTVITNSFDIIQVLGDCAFASLICIGGQLCAETAAFNGHMAQENIRHFYADKAFISCTSAHLDFGLTDHIESEAKMRETMLAHAKTRILIADNTKFDSVATHKLMDLDALDCVITDQALSEPWNETLARLEIDVLVAT
ncbi:MAG: DeoR/GlpR family DNA-binding transcription regulator [Oscillospiraceae bacterium]|nr:DeoR/GlpR family DNA-binding transcription regulator [Oscillospiraceae bacterium]